METNEMKLRHVAYDKAIAIWNLIKHDLIETETCKKLDYMGHYCGEELIVSVTQLGYSREVLVVARLGSMDISDELQSIIKNELV